MEMQFRGWFQAGELFLEEIRTKKGTGLNRLHGAVADDQFALLVCEKTEKDESGYVGSMMLGVRRLPSAVLSAIKRALKEQPTDATRAHLMVSPLKRALCHVTYRDGRLVLESLGGPADTVIRRVATDLNGKHLPGVAAGKKPYSIELQIKRRDKNGGHDPPPPPAPSEDKTDAGSVHAPTT